ncbi:hypothetical protein [Methylobacterium sp. JK268]
MQDQSGSALDLARRVERACLDHSRKALDLHRSATAAAQARDLSAAQASYRHAQDSLRLAQETAAQLLGALADFLRPRPRGGDPAP